ncbi:hypothetical protein HCN44_001810 [Aphidius gifuensis]|uniref:Uncharacterized protein n=1 Tax=Aphidius gifuensis TaxID=684658 RepID=A0A835CUD4_APHGI|nr:hypothetical protein HCN44_001810 [Aphidius gifuensis]
MKTLEEDFKEFRRSVHSKLDAILKNVRSPDEKVPKKPECLPFKNMKELLEFEKASDNTYKSVVDYLYWKRSKDIYESLTKYLKEGLDIKNCDFSSKMTCYGTRNQHAFITTLFSAACVEALSRKKPVSESDYTKEVQRCFKNLNATYVRMISNGWKEPSQNQTGMEQNTTLNLSNNENITLSTSNETVTPTANRKRTATNTLDSDNLDKESTYSDGDIQLTEEQLCGENSDT